MNLAIPESVKVGPHRYQILIEQEPFGNEEKTGFLCGQARHNEGVIRVLNGSPHRMFATLWHEILHAVDDVAGTDLSEDEVNRLAPIIAAVLIDNGYVDEDSPPEVKG